MGKIISCKWMDEQPTFKKEVKLKDGTVIGTIHALTKSDYSFIYTKSNNFENLVEFTIQSIIRSLSGHDCGWNFDREVTYDNVNLLPKETFTAFAEAINGFEKQNEVTDGIVKN